MNAQVTTPKAPEPCPFLPDAPPAMSWRDLRSAPDPPSRFHAALTYAQFLWLRHFPARAVLALCRGLYLNPQDLPSDARPPYQAFRWILENYTGHGFLGNPRISFFHQATRTRADRQLQRQRAWALWYLSRSLLPQLSPDPTETDFQAPELSGLIQYLNANGLPDEGSLFARVWRENGSGARAQD